MQGRLFAFEGLDGCGKSTQIELLRTHLSAAHIEHYISKEPTDGAVGKLLREVLSGAYEMDQAVIAALFATDRLDHLLNTKNGLLQMVELGKAVVTDRHYLSSFAYQSAFVEEQWLIDINRLSRQMLKPDIHIFIDIQPETAVERLNRYRSRKEIYENLNMLKQVRENYFHLFELLSEEETIYIVNGEKKPDVISEEIWALIKPLVE